MKGISIRLFLTSDVLARVVTAIATPKFRRFVRPPTTKPAGEFHQVDIRVLESYDAKTPKASEGIHPTEKVVVTREMLGELLDVFGIFPRTTDQSRILELVNEIHRALASLNTHTLPANLPVSKDAVKMHISFITDRCVEIKKLLVQ